MKPQDWTARDDDDAWAEWLRDHEDENPDDGEEGTARALASQGPAEEE